MFVYILISEKDGTLYVGCTKNLKNRLRGHNAGNVRSTKSKIPWKIIRSEEYESLSIASKREKFLKSGLGRRVVRNLCHLDS